MPLSSTQRESAIIAVLRALDAIHPMGMATRDLLTPVKLATQMQSLDEPTLNSLLHDMKDQQQVTSEPSPMNAAVHRWKRTEPARSMLESLGLL